MYRTFILSEGASVESLSIINPEPHPSGSSLSFLMPNLPPYYMVHWHVNESFRGLRSCLRRDDNESAYGEKKVSPLLWGMVPGISTDLARGCRVIAKGSNGFKVSLCSWIWPYPIPTVGLSLTLWAAWVEVRDPRTYATSKQLCSIKLNSSTL